MTNQKPKPYYAVFEVEKNGEERLRRCYTAIGWARNWLEKPERCWRKEKYIIRELIPGEVVK